MENDLSKCDLVKSQFILMIRLENVWKTSLQDVLKMYWRRLEYVLNMSQRPFCKTSWKGLENVLKTSWRGMVKTTILVLIKTSSEDVWVRWIIRLDQDVLKTSSEDKDERRLQDVFIKTNVPWVKIESKG